MLQILEEYKMIKVLQANKEYENNIRQYTKKDGISAIILFAIFILIYSILAVLDIRSDFVKSNILLIGCIFNVLITVITVLFVKIRKQKLDSIGLYNGKWRTSCIVGFILACIFLFNNCISHLIGGARLINIKEIIILSIYYLSVSFCEEIVFRGYIGTRIYGFIKISAYL